MRFKVKCRFCNKVIKEAQDKRMDCKCHTFLETCKECEELLNNMDRR